ARRSSEPHLVSRGAVQPWRGCLSRLRGTGLRLQRADRLRRAVVLRLRRRAGGTVCRGPSLYRLRLVLAEPHPWFGHPIHVLVRGQLESADLSSQAGTYRAAANAAFIAPTAMIRPSV